MIASNDEPRHRADRREEKFQRRTLKFINGVDGEDTDVLCRPSARNEKLVVEDLENRMLSDDCDNTKEMKLKLTRLTWMYEDEVRKRAKADLRLQEFVAENRRLKDEVILLQNKLKVDFFFRLCFFIPAKVIHCRDRNYF